MSCQRCGSDRILKACGKTSDMCCLNFQGRVYDGYVPRNANVGGGDYLDVQICLECGQAQGKWPVANAALPDELSVGPEEGAGLSWDDIKPENMHGAADGFGGEDYPSGHPIAHRVPCCANEDRDMRGGCRSCGDPCL